MDAAMADAEAAIEGKRNWRRKWLASVDEEVAIEGTGELEKGNGLDVALVAEEAAIEGKAELDKKRAWMMHCRMRKLPLKVKRNWTCLDVATSDEEVAMKGNYEGEQRNRIGCCIG